jgi:hypothetical protein
MQFRLLNCWLLKTYLKDLFLELLPNFLSYSLTYRRFCLQQISLTRIV